MTLAAKTVSAEELFEMGDVGRCELVDGEIIKMPPAGEEHGGIVMDIAVRIANFVNANRLGKV